MNPRAAASATPTSCGAGTRRRRAVPRRHGGRAEAVVRFVTLAGFDDASKPIMELHGEPIFAGRSCAAGS